ncbi:VOC family protein [Nocardioides sp. SR21]|uniref:VOC family protein n=1 Tax=Nocardioides sp. SR21 TaxID=2919501 RepID=UPI001FAA058E|nr:VOC family protein [Nocardioides sp. SR21]
MTAPFWVSAFLDFEADGFEDGVAFWQGVTGFALSERRGADDEFATLVPPTGDDYLRVQRLADGPGRLHLDLHVDSPDAATDAAAVLGATVLARNDGYVVLRSPGGMVFCFVSHPASERPPASAWPTGASQVDQVCLDIPPRLHDRELEFWHRVTGWELVSVDSPEFTRLRPPAAFPLQLLVQKLDDDADGVSAHLDLAADDRDAEVERHVALGASEGGRHDWWTVLTDPVGTTYCITRRKTR